jgi:hypothetical protein
MVALAVSLLGAQILAGLVAGVLLLVADDADAASAGLACLSFGVAALLAACAALLLTRRHDWPRWVVITLELPGLVLGLLTFVLVGLGGLPVVVACAVILYALSDPDVIDWFGRS